MNKKNDKKLIKKIASITIYTILIVILSIVILQKVTNNKISLFGYRIFRVVSESMVPEYKINDILLVKDIDTKDIKIGDNIAYSKKMNDKVDAIITHKVVNIEKDNQNGELIFHTKGIANTLEDPIVKEEQIYGVVINKIYLLSLINKLINNIFGYILLVFIPLLLIIYSHIKELIMMVKEKKDEE